MKTSFKCTQDNCIITAGAIQAVYNALALSIDGPEDEFISPLPAYGLYKHTTGLLGGKFYAIPTVYENKFIPSS